MNTRTLYGWTANVVRGWVGFYTKGVPAIARDARRMEVESDLWEHQQHALLMGRDQIGTAIEVFYRLLMGIPADLVWRWEHRTTGEGETAITSGKEAKRMERTIDDDSNGQRWILLAPVILGILAIGVGIDNLTSGTEENTLRDTLGSALRAGILGGFVPALLLALGLVFSWRSPVVGVAATLGILFLYLNLLFAWVGSQAGWGNEAPIFFIALAGTLLYLTGLFITRQFPHIGGWLAMIGSIPMAITGWWTIVLPIFAVMMGFFALQRARQIARAQEAYSLPLQ